MSRGRTLVPIMHKSMSHLLLERLRPPESFPNTFFFPFLLLFPHCTKYKPLPKHFIYNSHTLRHPSRTTHSPVMQGEDNICLPDLPPNSNAARYKDSSQAASQKFVVLMDCIKMPLLVLLPVIISWLWVAQSNTWMQFIHSVLPIYSTMTLLLN